MDAAPVTFGGLATKQITPAPGNPSGTLVQQRLQKRSTAGHQRSDVTQEARAVGQFFHDLKIEVVID